MRSYELFARYVMPRFQGSLDTIVGSNSWARENRKAVFGPNVAAVKKAFTDVGRAVPDEFRSRTVGARDVARLTILAGALAETDRAARRTRFAGRLELGCGGGGATPQVLAAAGLRVVAVDVSPEFVARARRACRTRRFHRQDIRRAVPACRRGGRRGRSLR